MKQSAPNIRGDLGIASGLESLLKTDGVPVLMPDGKTLYAAVYSDEKGIAQSYAVNGSPPDKEAFIFYFGPSAHGKITGSMTIIVGGVKYKVDESPHPQWYQLTPAYVAVVAWRM